MISRKSKNFVKNFLVRREILEQIKAGTCDLIDNHHRVQYILNGEEVSLTDIVSDDGEEFA